MCSRFYVTALNCYPFKIKLWFLWMTTNNWELHQANNTKAYFNNCIAHRFICGWKRRRWQLSATHVWQNTSACNHIVCCVLLLRNENSAHASFYARHWNSTTTLMCSIVRICSLISDVSMSSLMVWETWRPKNEKNGLEMFWVLVVTGRYHSDKISKLLIWCFQSRFLSSFSPPPHS